MKHKIIYPEDGYLNLDIIYNILKSNNNSIYNGLIIQYIIHEKSVFYHKGVRTIESYKLKRIFHLDGKSFFNAILNIDDNYIELSNNKDKIPSLEREHFRDKVRIYDDGKIGFGELAFGNFIFKTFDIDYLLFFNSKLNDVYIDMTSYLSKNSIYPSLRIGYLDDINNKYMFLDNDYMMNVALSISYSQDDYFNISMETNEGFIEIKEYIFDDIIDIQFLFNHEGDSPIFEVTSLKVYQPYIDTN